MCIQHNRKVTMLIIKSFTTDSFSFAHSHIIPALILLLRSHVSWTTILRYTQIWNTLSSSKLHEWNLLGIEAGGRVSNMVRAGKCWLCWTTATNTPKQDLHTHHGRGNSCLAGSMLCKPLPLLGTPSQALRDTFCSDMVHQRELNQTMELIFKITSGSLGQRNIALHGYITSLITHEPLGRFRGIIDCWRPC